MAVKPKSPLPCILLLLILTVSAVGTINFVDANPGFTVMEHTRQGTLAEKATATLSSATLKAQSLSNATA